MNNRIAVGIAALASAGLASVCCIGPLALTGLGLPVGERPREALFDLAADPGEFENLVNSPHYADVLADLRRRLDDWMERTDDPIRRGPIPPPPGAKITPHDAIDP